MKRRLPLILALCFVLLLMGCNTNTPAEMPTGLTGDITEQDFAVSDGSTTIFLDTNIKDFKTDETRIENNNDEAEVNGYIFYQYAYDKFEIYAGNLFYTSKNRDEKDNYISQVKIFDEGFKTPRGIGVGSTATEVYEAYGQPEPANGQEQGGFWYFHEESGYKVLFEMETGSTVSQIMLTTMA